MILVDTNVIIDVFANDRDWADWSRTQLKLAHSATGVAINDVIYAELAAGFEGMAQLDAALTTLGLSHISISRRALFLAGKAFRAYRRKGGVKTAILPDFIIGAHAADENLTLMTRDARRYRQYFPDLELITP